jgi:cytolysin-activating lysine-acyltransferase
LSEEVERDIHATGRALAGDEWQSGERLFCNDWITPHGNMREVAHDFMNNLFPDAVASSIRRNPDGTVRRVNRWTGVNLRRLGSEEVAA